MYLVIRSQIFYLASQNDISSYGYSLVFNSWQKWRLSSLSWSFSWPSATTIIVFCLQLQFKRYRVLSCQLIFVRFSFSDKRKFQISSHHVKSDSLNDDLNLQFHSALTTNVSVTWACFIYFSQKFFCTIGHRNFCTEALLQKFLHPIE